MTKVSKKLLSTSNLSSLFDQLCRCFTLMDTKQEIKVFLADLLSPTEKVMLSKRIGVAGMLLSGKTYDDIRSELFVTDDTISRIQNTLYGSGEGYRLAVEKLSIIDSRRKKTKVPHMAAAAQQFWTGLVAESVKAYRKHTKRSSAKS